MFLGKNEFSASFGWNVFYISVRFAWSILFFKSYVSILICLIVLSFIESGVLKYPIIIIIMFLFISPFSLSLFASYIWVL